MRIGRLRGMAIGIVIATGAAVGGCQETTIGVSSDASIHDADVDAIVAECRSGSSATSVVRQGMAQCDLVRLQGRPRDAVIAQMPDGRRRVELFYPGSGGTTRGYVFIADRLVSTPPGTLKE
jgi:hypothetical protein